jgi:ribonucleoside-diphosphate reductase alpha chain
MDSFAISVSHGLQYGVPLKSYVKTLMSSSFAPSGITDDADIRTASSIVDYIFRRLALTYLSFDDRLELGLADIEDMPEEQTSLLGEIETVEPEKVAPASAAVAPVPTVVEQPVASAPANKPAQETKAVSQSDTAPLCYNCGNQTQRAGTCYVCTSCGSTTGCS